jgi:hypothetical protein
MCKFVVTRILSFGIGLFLLGVTALVGVGPAAAQDRGGNYSAQELVNTGHKFFGTVSGGLATVIEEAVSRYGQPNGYILGEEGAGAVIGGLRYGEGRLNTRDRQPIKVFWQGPSIGWDFGGEGARTMMLVYNLPSPDALYQRFGGVDGSAYFIGGFGMTALVSDRIYVVPVRSGMGVRLGVNLGYLKFTPKATWNPF